MRNLWASPELAPRAEGRGSNPPPFLFVTLLSYNNSVVGRHEKGGDLILKSLHIFYLGIPFVILIRMVILQEKRDRKENREWQNLRKD